MIYRKILKFIDDLISEFNLLFSSNISLILKGSYILAKNNILKRSINDLDFLFHIRYKGNW